MEVTLYSVGPSHPGRTARLMLDHKGIEHRLVNLPPGSQPIALRPLGFRRGTVPALKQAGAGAEVGAGSAPRLDEVKPEPRLFQGNTASTDAGRGGRALGRRGSCRSPQGGWADGASPSSGRRCAPTWLVRPARWHRVCSAGQDCRWPGTSRAKFGANDTELVVRTVRTLPALLDRVDELLSERTIGGERRNAADFQIATTTRVTLYGVRRSCAR